MNAAFQSFAIVPAAGRSTRMGTAKLLLTWQGRTLIDHLLEAWLQSNVDRVVVVARADDDALIERLAAHEVELVLPPAAPPQMKDSVGAALVHILDRYRPQPHDAWLLAPADLPRLSRSLIDQVLAAARRVPGSIVVPRSGNRRGHPVLFPWPLHEAIFELGPDQGVNSLLERFRIEYVETAEPARWADIDRPDDYQRLQAGDGDSGP